MNSTAGRVTHIPEIFLELGRKNLTAGSGRFPERFRTRIFLLSDADIAADAVRQKKVVMIPRQIFLPSRMEVRYGVISTVGEG